MEEILKNTSTNGRWGVSVVCEKEIEFKNIMRGTIEHLGSTEGHEVFQFSPSETAETWILFGGNIDILSGGNIIIKEYLQSNTTATIAVLSDQAIVKRHGYKGRSSSVSCIIEGERKSIPASCLLAMGLIKSGGKKKIEIVPPPKLDSTMLIALKRAGLV